MVNLQKIVLREKSHRELAIAILRETGSSSMLNKIPNHACKLGADWFNHFYSPWESKGYKVES